MNTKLFVGNLAPDVTTEAIKGAFALHGSVSDVYLATNRVTARFRGFAFVTMDTEEGARKAIDALHGSVNNGRFLNVKEAPDSPDEGIFAKYYTPRREFRKLY
jgi:cold-inducible RNA-binding protein